MTSPQKLEKLTPYERTQAVIKYQPEDFIVEEITIRYGKLSINGNYKPLCVNEGNHLVCVFIKNNVETFEMVKHLCSLLHISPNRISFAGTKDKKAITIQLGSIYKVKCDKLLRVRNHMKGYDVIPLGYSSKKVYLGELKGNAFTITLRNIKHIEKISHYLEDYEEKYHFYFPNYYGIQRFGKNENLGLLLLKRDYEGFMKHYLSIDEISYESIQKKIDELKSMSHEKRMCLYLLHHHTKDILGAIKTLPTSLLKMMVNAYQSRVFNEVVSNIISQHKHDWEILKNKEIYIPGSDYEGFAFYDSTIQDVISLYERDEVKPSMFKFPEFGFESKGFKRRILEQATKVSFEVKKDDIFNTHALVLRFELNKGAYATSFLNELFEF